MSYASQYDEILSTLSENETLRARTISLVRESPMPGKALEGGGRLNQFREFLVQLIESRGDLTTSYRQVEQVIPRSSSPHAESNRVFASDWGERLVRTQLSVAYNEAVLRTVIESGSDTVDVPHSSVEAQDSQCSRVLAGTTHSAQELLEKLVASYRDGQFSRAPKIPDHPHCTHVVRPTT